MEDSVDEEQLKKMVAQVKTFPVPFSLGEIEENISICTNEINQVSKEQIFNQFRIRPKYNIKSGIKEGWSFHLSKYSRSTLDKQHTAVLSSSVARVISEQRLLWFTLNPFRFWKSGNSSCTASSNIR